MVALEAEKNIVEERKKLKEEGVIGTTMDALDGAASAVGSGVGMVGTGVATGAGLVGTGIGVETTLTSSICLFFVCHSILFCMSTQDMVCKYRIRTDALVLCNFRRRKRYFVLLIDLGLHDL